MVKDSFGERFGVKAMVKGFITLEQFMEAMKAQVKEEVDTVIGFIWEGLCLGRITYLDIHFGGVIGNGSDMGTTAARPRSTARRRRISALRETTNLISKLPEPLRKSLFRTSERAWIYLKMHWNPSASI